MRKKRNGYWYAAAFLLPMVCFALLSMAKDIYPFGGFSNYRGDLENQYHDFLCYLKEVLSGRSGIEYTFSKSLGGSPVALIGYYLMSPLNLLLVFFGKDQIQLFVYVITSLKLGLCGLFFCLYAARRFRLPGPALTALSLAYAFTQYGVGENFNIMWMDGVYMLPLVMLGVYRYVTEDKKTLLYLSIACSVVFNWYTGYMNCLFAALYYIYETVLHEDSFSPTRLVRRAFGGGMTVLLGVLLSGAVFVPTVLGQSAGRSIDSNFFNLGVNGRFLDILNGFLIGSAYPSEKITLFCTVALLLAFFSFWLLKNVSAKEKAAAGLLVGAMTASMYFKLLENIWCGFKFEYSYQYRFGYAATAAMVTVAGLALEKLREQDGRSRAVLKGAGIFAAVLLLADWVTGLPAGQLWAQIGLIALYAALAWGADWAGRRLRGGKRKAVVRLAALCAAVLFGGEVLLNAVLVQDGKNVGDAARNRDYGTAQQTLIDRLRPAESDFYRIEQTASRSTEGSCFYANEALAYGYGGIQSYTSCYDGPVADLIERAGYCSQSFPTAYDGPILPMDSFLGVRYLLSPTDLAGFEKTDIPGADGKDVYLDPYALPFGFAAAGSVTDPVEGEKFAYINGLYSSVLGERTEVFVPLAPVSVEQDGTSVVCRFPAGSDASGGLYMDFDGQEVRCGDVLADGRSCGAYDRSAWGAFDEVRCLGGPERLDQVTLVDCSVPAGELTVRFFQVDTQALRAASETLWDGAVTLGQVRDGYVRASYTAPEAGQVLLTIPIEKGWRATVNGEPVELLQGADIFTVVPVQAGDNEIVLEYTARGRLAGAALSVLSLAAFAAWSVYGRKRRA